MRKLAVLSSLVLALAVAAAGCGSDDDEEEGGATGETAAAATTAADQCAKEQLQLVEPGTLTVGTDNPAFPPWFEGTKEFEPWDPTTEPTKKGYEQETAYAIAGQLGFTDDEVKWTVVPFNQSFRPGDKPFDFDINQISFNTERAQAVDFSDSYYDVEQAIVTVEGSRIADAGSIADLKDAKLGAQIGTTSLEAINDTIQPSQEASVYDTNNDAIAGLKAKQIDGIVVDFPTALYMAAVQLDGGKVVGRLPAPEGGEYFGVVLEKDSPLTECVNQAIQAIKDDGTLDRLEEKWLTGSAPVLE
jgi:polar amino acid transport system substrate-binding protein